MVYGEAMTAIRDILELVDQGRGLGLGGPSVGVERGRCVRRGCSKACVDDSGFCAECHAWVTEKTTIDPLEPKVTERSQPPWSGSYPPTDDEGWLNYLSATRRHE